MTRPLKVIAAYSHYAVGDIVYPTGLLRGDLIRKKLCAEIERDEGELVETATVVPEERAVTRMEPKRGRGRPRKVRT